MILKFLAREDLLASTPGLRPVVGQAPSYIGRSFKTGAFPATKEPVEVDPASPQAARYREHAWRGHIWCADKETAAACGAEFVPVEFKDGAWLKSSKEIK